MTRLAPRFPCFLFSTTPAPGDEERDWVPIISIFKVGSSLSRSLASFSFGDTKEEIIERHREFSTESIEYITSKYFSSYYATYKGKSFGGLSHPGECIRIAKKYPVEGNIHPLAYCPFYYRYTFCVLHESHGLVSTPETRLMPPQTPCFQFIKGRDPKPNFTPCMAYSTLTRERYTMIFSSGGCNAAFNTPLFIITSFMGTQTISPNITESFLRLLQIKYRTTLSPQVIFGYIYAVMWHKDYRAQWASCYRPGYPSVPLVRSLDTFLDLASLGHQLYTLHTQVPNLPNQGY